MITKKQIVDAFSDGIATKEGFFLSEADCKRAGIPYPPVVQRNANPGALRSWTGFPSKDKFALFAEVDAEGGIVRLLPAAGWKALKTQVDLNVFNRRLTFFQFFAGQRDENGKVLPIGGIDNIGRRLTKPGYPGYAPALDGNRPRTYAQFLLDFLKSRLPIPADTTIDSVIATLRVGEEGVPLT